MKKFEQEQYVLFEQAEIEGYIAEFLGIGVRESRGVLRAIEAQHGLLIERSQKVWSFSHLTFQEYLTAKWISADHVYEKFVDYIADIAWREVFVLVTDLVQNPNTFVDFMHQNIKKMSVRNEKLQQALKWVYDKSKSIHGYKPAAIRAFCYAVYPAFRSDRPSYYFRDENHDLSQVCDIGLTAECLDLNLACSIDLELSAELQASIDANYALSLNRDLATDLVALLRSTQSACQPNDTISDELQNYYYANRLLIDCLNSVHDINLGIREEIEEILLLPVSEIERRKTQISD